VEHFEVREFLCPCCGGGKVSEVLVMWLEVLRRAWGEPVIVNSGWRCAARNVKVGGAVTSRHLIGCAADIVPLTKMGGAELREFAALAERICRHPGWEFLIYPTFIHVSVPRGDSERKWGGGKIVV